MRAVAVLILLAGFARAEDAPHPAKTMPPAGKVSVTVYVPGFRPVNQNWPASSVGVAGSSSVVITIGVIVLPMPSMPVSVMVQFSNPGSPGSRSPLPFRSSYLTPWTEPLRKLPKSWSRITWPLLSITS